MRGTLCVTFQTHSILFGNLDYKEGHVNCWIVLIIYKNPTIQIKPLKHIMTTSKLISMVMILSLFPLILGVVVKC
jgi:hypothetical protein